MTVNKPSNFILKIRYRIDRIINFMHFHFIYFKRKKHVQT